MLSYTWHNNKKEGDDDEKLNNKGSTIVTGIIVVMILLIIMGTALGIAYSYQIRAVNEHARKQAYLNGVSIADIVALKINENVITAPNRIESVTLPNTTLPDADGTYQYGGTIKGDIIVDEKNVNVIYIQITSTYNHQTEEVQLTMQKQGSTWYKKAYSKIGEKFNEEQ